MSFPGLTSLVYGAQAAISPSATINSRIMSVEQRQIGIVMMNEDRYDSYGFSRLCTAAHKLVEERNDESLFIMLPFFAVCEVA